MADRLDGRGDPVVANVLYYVADARAVVGNCMSWWCWEGKGYTCELDEAGWFTGEQVRGMRDTDVPWPIGFIDAVAVRHVRRDLLRKTERTPCPACAEMDGWGCREHQRG